MGHVRYGFAPGCEAVWLCPAVYVLFSFGLCPWCGLWPNDLSGRTANAANYFGRRIVLASAVLLMQKAQREFEHKSDEERMVHAATMGVIEGGASQSAVLESARKARAAAESRKTEIRKRAFVPVTTPSDRPKPCSEGGPWLTVN